MSQGFTGGRSVGLPERDLETLADFLADALDPAQSAGVARLVATDARWSAAHQAMIYASKAVRADLRAAADESAMPDDVATRLELAFAAAGASATSRRPARERAVARRGRQSAARRGWGPWAGLAAAAASIVAVIGGIAVATQFVTQSEPATSAQYGNPEINDRGAADAPGGAPPPSAPVWAFTGAPSFMISGMDYGRDTLVQLGRAAPAAGGGPLGANTSKYSYEAEIPQAIRDAAPAELARLTEPAALAACLQAIRAAHPGTVALVDYARFAGQPALVVLVRLGSAATVVAVGPDCGAAGADERAAESVP